MAAAGLWPAQAAQGASAVIDVPCSAAALASDMSSVTSGGTLSLTARCGYRLTAGLPVVNADLTILGNGATLRRSQAPATPAFAILSIDSGTVAVSNLNFANGAGAISVTGASSSLTLQGGTFTGNNATSGGAIYDNTGQGNLSVTGATFTGNTAAGSGGAIYTGPLGGNLSVTSDTFTGNTAGGGGGAIFDFNVYGGNITDCGFYRNRAADGGAIVADSIGGGVLDGVFHSNNATQDGGAILSIYAPLSVGGTISGNHAGSDGGGIYLGSLQYADVGMTLTAAVQGNSAEDGGGIYSFGSVADLTNSTIDHNDATADGGGIYNYQVGVVGYGTVNLETSKVSGNEAGADGGGIYTTGGLATVTASGTPVVHNAAVSGGGGIYEGPGATVTLTNSPVLDNKPDNCEPPGSIADCTAERPHDALWRRSSRRQRGRAISPIA